MYGTYTKRKLIATLNCQSLLTNDTWSPFMEGFIYISAKHLCLNYNHLPALVRTDWLCENPPCVHTYVFNLGLQK